MLTKLKTIFAPSVLKSLSIVFLHWMLFCLGYLVVYTFLPVVSTVYGIKDNVMSSMLSIFGVSDFIGRLSFGVMANTKKIKSVYLVCIVGSSSGAACPLFNLDSANSGDVCLSCCTWNMCRSVEQQDKSPPID